MKGSVEVASDCALAAGALTVSASADSTHTDFSAPAAINLNYPCLNSDQIYQPGHQKRGRKRGQRHGQP